MKWCKLILFRLTNSLLSPKHFLSVKLSVFFYDFYGNSLAELLLHSYAVWNDKQSICEDISTLLEMMPYDVYFVLLLSAW